MATQINLGSTDNTRTLGNDDYNVIGTDGNNTLTLGSGTDTVTLGNGSNTLTLANGADQITLGIGNNTITTGSGADTITATDGSNTVTVGDGNDNVVLGNGSDSVTSGNGNSVITVGNGADDTLTVGSGSNTLAVGTGAADAVNTASGGNTLSIATASLSGDTILGNLNSSAVTPNTLVLTTAGTTPVTADVTSVSGFGVYDLASGAPTSLTLTDTNFARVTGATISVVGTSGGSTIVASGVSAANSVSVYLGTGANTATGGSGDDFFYGAPGEQATINGGAGYDTMTFSGPQSDYNITTAADGVITVTGDGEDDVLTSIENIVYNGNVSVALTSDTGFSNTDGITSDDSLNGTAEAGSLVSISDENASLGTTTANSSGVWTYTPANLADGAHTLTASETNAAGTTSSASISMTLETVPPVVTIGLTTDTGSSSTDGITNNPALSGTAEAGSLVSISSGGTAVGTATAAANGSWVYIPTGLADGTQAFTASETDAAGNTGSANFTFTLDTTAPTVTAALADDTGTSSTDGLTADDALTGTAEGGSTVTILNGTTVLGSTVAAADGTWNFTPTGLADAPYTLTASETDVAGNTGSASVSLTLDTAGPVLTLALQDDTGASATDNITNDPTIVGTATGAGTVVVSLNGKVVESYQSPGGQQTYTPTGLADGNYQAVITDTNAAGVTSTASLNVTLDTTPPVVTAALAQDSGASGTNGTTNNDSLAGTAEANGTVTITNDNGNAVLGTTTVGADGSWNFTPAGLADGNYSLTASETDIAGNTGTATVAFTLNSAAPTVTAALADDTGSSAHDGITNDARLSGTAAVGSTVTITEGSSVLGSATADTNGNWAFTPPGLADGSHTLVVSQTDAAGNTGTADVGLTLITTPPDVTAGLMQDTGASATDGITNVDALVGTAEAGGTVSILDGTTVLGTAAVDANGNWTYAPTGLADGSITLTATETDVAGNTGSSSVNLTLLTATPVVTVMLTAADAGGSISGNGTLGGTAEAGSTVTILNGTTVLGTTVAGSDGSWTYTAGGLPDGDYTLTASQSDAAGNTGTASVNFVLSRAYTANVGNIDDASNVFVVLDKPGLTANIDLTNNTQAVTVFGGAADMNLTAANAVVVVNGPGQTSDTTVTSLGNDFIWGGQSTVDLNGDSGNRVVLNGNGATSGTLNLGTSGTASNEVDVWGVAGTTQTVNNLGSSQAVVFGGTSDLDFTGGNSVIVLNGSDQTGAATVDSTGGNTVWAGTSTLSFTEGTSGDDTLVLTGASGTTVHGASGASTGTTTIQDVGGTGQFEYDGGSKTANISIGAEQATVYGGSGNQTLALNGQGSLVIADSDTVSGLQTVTVAPGASGSLAFWGGSSDANITLGAGSAFIQAGTGNTTLTGGSGSTTLDLSKSENTLLNVDGGTSGGVNVLGYTGSNATLNVTNVDSQTIVGGSLVMHLHDGSSITFQSYVPSHTIT